MSKKVQSQQPVVVDNSKRNKILLIAIVAFVTAAVIAVSLVIALWDYSDDKSVAVGGGESLDRSTETISNGDFEFLEELSTSYPKIAQDWTKYTYKKPASSTSHGYNKVTAAHPTLMGVIDTTNEQWDTVDNDLKSLGVTLSGNPGIPVDAEGSLVYMIHNFEATTASIYSNSFTIGATASVKITLDVKTVGLTEGVGGFVMIKQQSSSALEKSSTGVQYWYASKGVVDGDTGIDTNGQWQTLEFFIFNRTTSSRTVYFNTGLGNVYNGAGETGTMFVDNIVIEDATSNDYREVVASQQNPNPNDHTAYVIEAESNDNDISYVNFSSFSADAVISGTTSNYVLESAYLTDYEFMPAFEFVTDEAFSGNYIHKIQNDGTINAPITATSNAITIESPATSSQYLISLWVRVKSADGTILPNANIYLVGPDGDLNSFTTVTTSDKLETDTNNGWAKYSFYVQPSDKNNIDVSVLVAFGDKVGYSNTEVIPNGTLYFTDLIVEEITQSQFANASVGGTSKKVSLNGAQSTTTVPNGSFSNYVTNSNSTDPLVYPKDWTQVYAGQNELYSNGEDNITVNTAHNAVESGILLGGALGPKNDDEIGGILKIDNKLPTSFGYLSSNFTLSANTVYVISLLVKAEGTATPSVYLLEENANGILQSYEGIPSLTAQNSVDSTKWFSDPEPDVNGTETTKGGWTKLFFVVATGDKAVTAKLALFNGKIDATEASGTSTGAVYFDRITLSTIGTYVRNNETNDLWQMDVSQEEFLTDSEGNYILVTDTDILHDVKDTIATGYGQNGNNIFYKDFKTLFEAIKDYQNVEIVDLRFDADYINDPVLEEEAEEEEETTSDIDWALLVSIISSSVLIGALVVVVFVKFIFRRPKYTA